MDYLNIISENKTLLKNSEFHLKELFQLLEFFKLHLYYYKETASTYKNKFQILEKKFNPLNSILFNNIQKIKQTIEKSFEKTFEISNKMEKEVIFPLEDFGKSQQTTYQQQINQLNKITYDILKYKKFLDLSKKEYYNCNYLLNEINNKAKTIKGNFQQKELYNDKIIKVSAEVKNDEFIYKSEIERYNKQILNYNQRYFEIKNEIKQNEEIRINLIKTMMDKYKNFMIEFQKNSQEYIDIINKLISPEIIEKDKFLIYDEINKYEKNNERLPKENFISFSDFIKKNGQINIQNLQLNEKDLITKFNNVELNHYLNKIFTQLKSEINYPIDDISVLIELIKYQNNDYDKQFLALIIEKTKKGYTEFLNLNNLELLGEIFSLLAINNSSIMSNKFDLNFAIIFIAQKTYYYDKETNKKIFLCAILSKNKYFRTKTFWKNICEVKLSYKINELVLKINDMDFPKEKENDNFFSKFMYIFNDDIYKASLIGKSRIYPLIKNYTSVETSKINLCDQLTSQEMSLIIKEFIPSFSCFNVSFEDSLNMISELIEDYKINKNYLYYYQINNNISNHTIKRFLKNEIKTYFNFTKVVTEKKNIKLLSSTLKFLDKKDYINLLLLSKNIGKSLKKKIYNLILKDSKTDNKLRLKLWENYLNISSLKKKYNYEEILKSVNDDKLKNKIQKDVLRTRINDNEKIEEKRNQMLNILYCVSTLNGDIKYYQGMNYIVELLLEITNEENSFYIFLSFFFNTQYNKIFNKDLNKLKAFYYIFNRLISLFEPELYYNLYNKSIDSQLFASPWFITLFLTSRQFILEKEIPKTLFRILDNFILDGWKSLMKIGLLILKVFVNDLLKMNYEETLQFLINDLFKKGFFKDENFDKVDKSFDDKKIKNKLIKDIENEFIQEQKFNNNQNNKK